jgi:beta-glucanase (GH16 family)
MKKAVLFALILPVLAGMVFAGQATLNSLTQKERAEGWKLLFNGTSFDGWRGYGQTGIPEAGWKIEDGLLKTVAKQKGADLITVDTFGDFEFSWEWNISAAGNNGIKYFVTEERPGAPGHEYQMIDDAANEEGKNGPKRATGAFYDVIGPDEDRPLKPAGAWNQSRVLVQGNHAEHWLNGRKVLDYELGSDRVKAGLAESKFKKFPDFGTKIQGHIMLTYHSDECWFRNLKIRGLPAEVPPTSAASREPAWKLVWNDEFDGPDNSPVDAGKWGLETGGSGWGNNELQYYTNRRNNARIEGGMLALVVDKEPFQNRNYTSARLKTQGRFEQMYGKFEARIKLPQGQGIWPAFWMLGNDFGTTARWPDCGEIDIMENIGKEPAIVHGTIHGPGYSGGQGPSAAFALPGGRKFADDFHVFAIEWDPDVIRWYVDGTLYGTQTRASAGAAGKKWVFDHPFFLILNVAVGGNWPGSPDGATVFPQKMLVDYVRVHQRGTF